MMQLKFQGVNITVVVKRLERSAVVGGNPIATIPTTQQPTVLRRLGLASTEIRLRYFLFLNLSLGCTKVDVNIRNRRTA